MVPITYQPRDSIRNLSSTPDYTSGTLNAQIDFKAFGYFIRQWQQYFLPFTKGRQPQLFVFIRIFKAMCYYVLGIPTDAEALSIARDTFTTIGYPKLLNSACALLPDKSVESTAGEQFLQYSPSNNPWIIDVEIYIKNGNLGADLKLVRAWFDANRALTTHWELVDFANMSRFKYEKHDRLDLNFEKTGVWTFETIYDEDVDDLIERRTSMKNRTTNVQYVYRTKTKHWKPSYAACSAFFFGFTVKRTAPNSVVGPSDYDDANSIKFAYRLTPAQVWGTIFELFTWFFNGNNIPRNGTARSAPPSSTPPSSTSRSSTPTAPTPPASPPAVPPATPPASAIRSTATTRSSSSSSSLNSLAQQLASLMNINDTLANNLANILLNIANSGTNNVRPSLAT